MKSEFEEPVYLDIGQPEEPPLQLRPMGIEKAAELLRVDVDDVIRLINEGQIRVYPKAEGWPKNLLAVDGSDVYRIYLAKQKGDEV
jgi:hypothetical protein